MKIPHMIPLKSTLRLALAAGVLAMPRVSAAEPTRIVFQNGRSVDIAAVAIQGESVVIKSPADGFTAGQTLPLATADHVFGDKPAELNAGVALVLNGQPAQGRKLLEPIVESLRVTASIPGNYWLEAARATLVGYAIEGDSAKCTELGKQISDATPAAGNDPFVALGKALLLPASSGVEARDTALGDLTTDNLPAEICAYASFFRGNLLKSAKRPQDALEAYLKVPCLFPAGGLILNAAAELNASEILANLKRREEAVSLLNSAARGAAGTAIAAEAAKRLQSTR